MRTAKANECSIYECLAKPGRYFARMQDDLNVDILRMFKGTFSIDTSQLFWLIFNLLHALLAKHLWVCKHNDNWL